MLPHLQHLHVAGSVERTLSERHTSGSPLVSASSETAFPVVAQENSAATTPTATTETDQPTRRRRKSKQKPLKSPLKVTEVTVPPNTTQTMMLGFQSTGSNVQEVREIQLDKAPEVVQQLLEISQAGGDGQVTTLTLTREHAQEILGQLYAGAEALPSNVNISLVQPDGAENNSATDNKNAEVPLNQIYVTPSSQDNATETIATTTLDTESLETGTAATVVSMAATHSVTQYSSSIPAVVKLMKFDQRMHDKDDRTMNRLSDTSSSYLAADIMQLITQTKTPTTKN